MQKKSRSLWGHAAIDFLKTNKVDLILLDIGMPVMTGFEFLDEARKLNICDDTIIIIRTSSNDSRDINMSKTYEKVSGYVVKPLTRNKLESASSIHLKAIVPDL